MVDRRFASRFICSSLALTLLDKTAQKVFKCLQNDFTSILDYVFICITKNMYLCTLQKLQ